ncbi:hypothetical protein FHU33_4757 [Blastococcus colisei]|uniref:Uncharacterized protein n=1 Tax=Blastococcus colisei TaxID=1564162 RepID=A0A543P1V7_9ACTN|nr:hypothetical protein FHU33_4757 [Blastococcus colisei]
MAERSSLWSSSRLAPASTPEGNGEPVRWGRCGAPSVSGQGRPRRHQIRQRGAAGREPKRRWPGSYSRCTLRSVCTERTSTTAPSATSSSSATTAGCKRLRMASMANTGGSPSSTNSTAPAVVAVNAFLTSSALPARTYAQRRRRGAGRGRGHVEDVDVRAGHDLPIGPIRGHIAPEAVALRFWASGHDLTMLFLTGVLCREALEPMQAVPVDPPGESSRMGGNRDALGRQSRVVRRPLDTRRRSAGRLLRDRELVLLPLPQLRHQPWREWCTRAGRSADVPTDWSRAVSRPTVPR